MSVLEGLKPERVFYYFEGISKIPHGSGNVQMISDYLVKFARDNNLYVRQDENYNVVIKKPCSNKDSDSKPVVLQGHIDMVAVKEENCVKDMSKEGLDLFIDGDYIGAKGTTLGADDGIAVAYALALLEDNEYSLPPIEAIFTVDEEIGMLGATAMDLSDIEGKVMLNIDNEIEGSFLTSCAGGARIDASFPVTFSEYDGQLVKIDVKGLTGGHSGTEIIRQRANANVVLGRILFEISKNVGFNIVSILGGEKDNAICPASSCEIIISKETIKELTDTFEVAVANIKYEYAVTDPDMNIIIEALEEIVDCKALDESSTTKAILTLNYIPDGVVRMSNDIEGLVQTSLNLGIVELNDTLFESKYLVRSSVDSEKAYLIDKVRSIVSFLGGDTKLSGVYPAWEYRTDSQLREAMCEIYEKQTGKNAVVEAIHAGVECGIMTSKIENLDCVSFGPDILDIHTPKERLSISSVERTWDLLVEVLQRLGQN